MDLSPNNTHTLDKDTQTPPPTQPTNTKSSSFTNGSLKPHHPTATSTSSTPPPPPSTVVISYKECLKNHAASIGGHALDGCGEFMSSSSSNPSEPRSLTCAACGCHRNFHRRDNNPKFPSFYHSSPPLPRRGLSLSTNSPSSLSPSPSPISSSPPPISHHFPPSYAVPHMLLSLGNAYSDDQHRSFSFFNSSSASKSDNKNQSGKKKRCRTKFSQEQKEKMHSLCEKLGWRMNKEDEGLIQEFCNEVGIPRGVFKVWMHNNKNVFKKRSLEMLGNAPNDEKINGNHNGNGDDGGRGGFDDRDDINNSLEHN